MTTEIKEWTGALHDLFEEPLSRDVYYSWFGDQPDPWIAHVCWKADRWQWSWAGTGAHTLVSRVPLHLEPSIGWMSCCGRHGWIRNGLWEPTADDDLQGYGSQREPAP